MNRTITVSEDVYARLEALAQQHGLSVEVLLDELSGSTNQEAERSSLALSERLLAQLMILYQATLPDAREATSAEKASVSRAMQRRVKQRLRLSDLMGRSGSEEL